MLGLLLRPCPWSATSSAAQPCRWGQLLQSLVYKLAYAATLPYIFKTHGCKDDGGVLHV